ncbi:exodeoxyribonuclease VII large subunit [Sneathiella chinensis]|uniref:Exodeoxyribonuclease 7 large subunit n=1 Tax=Sneathiella chinensis TaxID=349750 RepID=A0ABQ5U0C1_9PROT|nr:exodeoxyribonuclease VII large subunit [Sneathiella chinensis]GLQ05657.1 exodeoxyribonuclease 7 large subunit [Sneathiella chinensis]
MSNIHEYTVSELSGALKRTVEDQFGHVRVRAEISGLKRAASGHVYLALKDERAVLDGVMWKGLAQKLTFRPEDGLEVICTGKLTTYPGRSKYQIVIEAMEPAGVGALMALLEERKRKLAAEGLFAPERKQPLPYLPRVIGVVTSPTGAVIRDILHRLRDRFPTHVLLWPVLVQGETAAAQVAAAIRGFNALDPEGPIARPDLLIVARGGGSLEDLWAFNEEEVVRAAAESQIPLISAVGHETDTTLIDYASDRRAPTPTAAAEMAVPVRSELLAYVEDLDRRKKRSLSRSVTEKRERLTGLARGLRDPQSMIAEKTQHLDHLDSRLRQSVTNSLVLKQQRFSGIQSRLRREMLDRTFQIQGDRLNEYQRRMTGAMTIRQERAGSRLSATARMLESLSFKRVLSRGYSIVQNEDGQVISSIGNVSEGTVVDITFADGTVDAVIGKGGKIQKTAKKKPSNPAPAAPAPKQGTLL